MITKHSNEPKPLQITVSRVHDLQLALLTFDKWGLVTPQTPRGLAPDNIATNMHSY